jgi:4-hydroxybenzoyl-CoA reductase subunit beta
MIRLPRFEYRAPRTVAEAADLLAASPGDAMLLAGGTDLLPNMKRRQQTPRTLVALGQIAELRRHTNGDGHRIGAGLTLTTLVRDEAIRRDCTALWEAAAQVATPHLRAMGTIGGNLCLDTRCNYYDQSYEWRKAIDFCMKKDGDRCWVATSSPTCLAVSSTDTAPALMALRARVTLVSARGTRDILLSDLYENDGMRYMTRRPDEILTAIHIPDMSGWRSTYWKLRRRGSFDFPVLGVAAAVRLARDGTVEDARIVLGAVASRPLAADRAAESLIGRPLTDESSGSGAPGSPSPSRWTTPISRWCGANVTRDFVSYAPAVCADDLAAVRQRITKRTLQA